MLWSGKCITDSCQSGAPAFSNLDPQELGNSDLRAIFPPEKADGATVFQMRVAFGRRFRRGRSLGRRPSGRRGAGLKLSSEPQGPLHQPPLLGPAGTAACRGCHLPRRRRLLDLETQETVVERRGRCGVAGDHQLHGGDGRTGLEGRAAAVPALAVQGGQRHGHGVGALGRG
jgi:hypothetical protein